MTSEIVVPMQAESSQRVSRKTRYINATIRVLLGLFFAVFGLSGFVNFMPQPSTPLPAGATAFLGALMATGYMLPLISATQLIVGVLLLSNRFVPLALTLLAPFTVNSILFHLLLEPSGRPMAFIILALQLYLVWTYRESYRAILSPRAEAH